MPTKFCKGDWVLVTAKDRAFFRRIGIVRNIVSLDLGIVTVMFTGKNSDAFYSTELHMISTERCG